MKENASSHRAILLLYAALLLGSCGGGSAGTGIGDSSIRVQGLVQFESGAPAGGLLVSVAESSDATTTDSTGQFGLDTSPTDSLRLIIESPNNGIIRPPLAEVPVSSPEVDGVIDVNLVLGSIPGSFAVDELRARTKIVGFCDIYFDNFRTIRQSNAVGGATECTAKSVVRSTSQSVSHLPVVIEVRSCAASAAWRTIAAGSTQSAPNQGVAQVRFSFVDDAEHCLYRVVIAGDDSGTRTLTTFIQTFTYQAFTR